MIQRLCHRCSSVLHSEDEGTLIFCWNCGAAQVTLSEELQELAATQRSEFAASSQPLEASAGSGSGGNLVQVPDLQVIWKAAIAIAAAVAAGISVLAGFVPGLSFLAWMGPAIVLAIYSARHRETRITAAVGARVGLVCGIFSGFGICVAAAVRMLSLHRGHGIMAEMTPGLLQAKARIAAQSGQAAADAVVNPMLKLPEFHAGLLLFTLAFCVAVLLALSTAGGAFAGFVRSRTKQR